MNMIPNERELEALLRECYEWLFESKTDGPRVSEGAIAKGYYTEAFAEFHNRLQAALTREQREGVRENDAIAAAFREVIGPNGAKISNDEIADYITQRSKEIMASAPQPEAPGAAPAETFVVQGAFGRNRKARKQGSLPTRATPPEPVDVRKVKALLDDHSAGKLHSDQFVQAISALYELALLDGQQAVVDDEAARKAVGDVFKSLPNSGPIKHHGRFG